MHNPGDLVPGVPRSTRSTIAEAARQLLHDSDRLSHNALIQISENFQIYRGRVPDDDLVSIADEMVRLIGHSLSDDDVPVELADVPERLGRRRLDQGVGLEELLHNVRRNFRIVWHALADTLARDPSHSPDMLRDAAILVWEVLDSITERIATGYHERELAADRRREALRTQWVERWQAEGDTDPGVADMAAEALGMVPTGDFIACVGQHAHDDPTRACTRALEHLGCISYWREYGGRELGLIQSSNPIGPEVCRSALEGTITGHLALSPQVHGATHVPTAIRLAHTVLRAMSQTRSPAVRTLHDVAIDAVAVEAGDVVQYTTNHTLVRLWRLGENERSRLLTTLRSLFTTGSIAQTAKLAYVHRNTVLNHIQRVQQLTGLDPRVPNDAAILMLAISKREPSAN